MNREKVINDLQDAVNDNWIWRHADYYALTMERAIALLKEQEPVRCKDCVHYRCYGNAENTVSVCKIDHCENPDKDWFCADGQREN